MKVSHKINEMVWERTQVVDTVKVKIRGKYVTDSGKMNGHREKNDHNIRYCWCLLFGQRCTEEKGQIYP